MTIDYNWDSISYQLGNGYFYIRSMYVYFTRDDCSGYYFYMERNTLLKALNDIGWDVEMLRRRYSTDHTALVAYRDYFLYLHENYCGSSHEAVYISDIICRRCLEFIHKNKHAIAAHTKKCRGKIIQSLDYPFALLLSFNFS